MLVGRKDAHPRWVLDGRKKELPVLLQSRD